MSSMVPLFGPSYAYEAVVDRVVDGDTLDLTIDLGFRTFTRQRVRLYGVDTPEVYGVKKGSEEYLAGKAASDFTKRWVDELNDLEVLIRSHDGKPFGQGKYGRWLVEVWSRDPGEDCQGAPEESLNDALVEAGHAVRVEY